MYTSNLRRIQASLLLLLFSLGLFLPLLAASPASTKLPSCCRRDGKHRCAMNTSQKAHGTFLTAHCDQYPTSSLGQISILQGLAPTQHTNSPLAPSIIVASPSRLTLSHLFNEAASQRGPPSSTL
jgi:hypothetical protein